MQVHDITFPSTVGPVVRGFRDYLAAVSFAGVTVQPKLPSTKTARMATVRDDSGTTSNGLQRRRHAFNLWADSPVDAESLAIHAAAYCRSVLAALEISGPLEVTDSDDDAMSVAGKPLSHYFVSAVVLVRASDL